MLNRPWRVIEHTPQRVVGQFQASLDDPSLLTRWPADFRLTVAYELSGNRLRAQIEAHNPDSKPLPMGLGLHPYFRVPIAPGGRAEDCRITMPGPSIGS